MGAEQIAWQTMMFATLAFTQIGYALGLRAASESVLKSLSANPAMICVLLGIVIWVVVQIEKRTVSRRKAVAG